VKWRNRLLNQDSAMLPEMLRRLWRDSPRPDDAQDDGNRKLLLPD